MAVSVTPLWQRLLVCVIFAQFILAQSLTWVRYPTEVVTGKSYPVEWSPRGVGVTVQILKGGQYQTTIFYSADGSTTNFNWNVNSDLESGSDYMLQVVPASGGQILSSGDVWVIGNGGLVVSGQTITASVPNGPSPPTPVAGGSKEVTFTEGGSTFVVTTDVGGAAATDAVRTLTYVSGSNTYTQTITLSSSPTDSANGNYSYARGLSGGEIAGVVIGVVAGVALIVLLAWFLRRKQRQRKTVAAAALAGSVDGEKDDTSISGTTANDVEGNGNRNTMMSGTSELVGSDTSGVGDKKQHTYQPYRVPRSEMDGSSSRFEMPAAPAPVYEMPAEEVRRGPQVPSTCVPLNPDSPGDASEAVPKEGSTKLEGEKEEKTGEEKDSSPKPVKPVEPDA